MIAKALFVIVGLCALLSVATAGTVVLKVTLVTKDGTHPYFGTAGGISTGFAINGVQGAALTLSSGQTYIFDTTSIASNHPVYITTSAAGGFAGLDGQVLLNNSANGISLTGGGNDYSAAFGGKNITWTVPASFEGKTYFYQCNYHQFMGFKITFVPETFCEKYTRLTNSPNQTALMRAAMSQIIGDLAADTLVGPYFKGQEPCCQTNFTQAANFELILTKLVTFFGPALGCNEQSFARYTGNPNMKTVHLSMPIGINEYRAFVSSVNRSLVAIQVTQADASFVAGFIDTTFKADVCNSVGCRTSICDRYSDALGINNTALLGTVVDGAIGKLVATGAPTLKYFDGTKPAGSKNFLTNAAQLAALRAKLIDFFWGPLGCTDTPARNYSGANMSVAHAAMGISQSEQDFFISAVVDTLTGAGVSSKDANAVQSLLQSLSPQIVVATAPGPVINKTFTITTAAKTSSHPQFGVGFPTGFNIDGVQGATIELEVGRTYKFTSTAACIHPFYFVDGAVGAGVDTELSTGISSADYSLVCNSGNDITFTVTQANLVMQTTSGKMFYYNCRVHGNMGGRVKFCPVGGCFVPTSICDRYSVALGVSNAVLVGNVVDGAIAKLVDAAAPTKKYFDGTKPSGSTNFLTNAARLSALREKLIDFFWAPLGCSMDMPGRNYTGGSMTTVHQPMGINQAESDFFNNAVYTTLTGAGVTTVDADTVRGVLESLNSQIVSQTTTPVQGVAASTPITVVLAVASIVILSLVSAMY